MNEDQARTRSGLLRQEGIPAMARATAHPDGWPNRSDEWEVAIRDTGTHRYYHEYDSRVRDLVPPHLRNMS